jgi:hypothetical protein
VNIIHAREKGPGEFSPTNAQRCFLCMEHGSRFVFIRGRRKYACARHYREWEAECLKSEKHRDRILNEE